MPFNPMDTKKHGDVLLANSTKAPNLHGMELKLSEKNTDSTNGLNIG